MGMAASQARLLSITSRLSDNELRSQIINNAKMRLATESSKVSERYVQALNDTKYMFSSYDRKGAEQYQDLTFANMTAYSSYNNQYGLRNLSGQLLVSETTAYNYEQAVKTAEGNDQTTDLEEFLKCYNLEKGTSFFKNMKDSKFDIDAALGVENSGLTPEILEIMYLGGTTADGVTHDGYDKTLEGAEYNVKYEPLFTDYNEKYARYQEEMFEYCDIYNKEPAPDGQLNLNDLKGKAQSTTDVNTLKGYFGDLAAAVTTAGGKGIENDSFFNDFAEGVSAAAAGLSATSSEMELNTVYVESKDDAYFSINLTTGILVPLKLSDTETIENEDGSKDTYTSTYSYSKSESADGEYYIVTQSCTGGGETTKNEYYIHKDSGSSYLKNEYDGSDLQAMLISYINVFLEESPYHYDYNKFTNIPADSDAAKARDAFNDAAKALSVYMFGGDVGKENYLLLNDVAFLLNNQDIMTDGQNNANGDNMKSVFDVLILDAIFNVLGEPTVTWIDKTNPDEDATAKAEWYTNLFNRMRIVEKEEETDKDGNITVTTTIKSNYQVLENGLATSPEWIRYALESGLVTMEQVNDNNEWCSTPYNNCSDITETTDKTEATIAEVEYNNAMAKIQAKDKQYDLQLKNIDTEHNSLQTEYDSIKTVLDKHIERNFKMYSA